MDAAAGKERARALMGRLSKWWEGPFIPHDNEAGASIVRIGGYHRRPRGALVVEAIGRWFAAHYWRVLTLLCTVAGLWIAYHHLRP
jgi:hypothetical protein